MTHDDFKLAAAGDHHYYCEDVGRQFHRVMERWKTKGFGTTITLSATASGVNPNTIKAKAYNGRRWLVNHPDQIRDPDIRKVLLDGAVVIRQNPDGVCIELKAYTASAATELEATIVEAHVVPSATALTMLSGWLGTTMEIDFIVNNIQWADGDRERIEALAAKHTATAVVAVEGNAVVAMSKAKLMGSKI